jgi:hypothetical protein
MSLKLKSKKSRSRPKKAEPKRVMVLLSKGGLDEHLVDAASLHVPDLWGVAEWLGVATRDGIKVLACWHLCHDLLTHVQEKE